MPVYLVERERPVATLAQLAAIRDAAPVTCDKFTTESKPVRHLGSTCAPGESRCLCLFEAPAAQRV
jgi:hypothetical protein